MGNGTDRDWDGERSEGDGEDEESRREFEAKHGEEMGFSEGGGQDWMDDRIYTGRCEHYGKCAADQTM